MTDSIPTSRLPTPRTATSAEPSGRPGVVLVRYWAGARAAAGLESEDAGPGEIAGILDDLAARHPALTPVLPVCALLLDGLAVDRTAHAAAGTVLEVLPPFAGG